MLPQQVFAAPANKEFVESISEIAYSVFEIKHLDTYKTDPNPARPSMIEHFRYRPGECYNELTVFTDDVFRWNQMGQLLSAPLKSEDEWLEWIGRL